MNRRKHLILLPLLAGLLLCCSKETTIAGYDTSDAGFRWAGQDSLDCSFADIDGAGIETSGDTDNVFPDHVVAPDIPVVPDMVPEDDTLVFVCQTGDECLELYPDLPVCHTVLCVDGQCKEMFQPAGTECEFADIETAECDKAVCTSGGVCEVVSAEDGAKCKETDACAKHVCLEGECIAQLLQDCEDDNPCTNDVCAPDTGCVYTYNEDLCDDSNPCTMGDHCKMGKCIGEENICQCTTDEECADFEDGDYCNGVVGCIESECVAKPDTVVVCEPSPDACLSIVCVPASGDCVPEFFQDGTPCDDADICTAGDACFGGKCEGILIGCDDENTCTDDSCDPELGCQHAPNSNPCDDDDICTLKDKCIAGICIGTSPMDCDDANLCTKDKCNPESGCVHEPLDGLPCDDGDPCTKDDQCLQGQCKGAAFCQCQKDSECNKFDDGNLCNGVLICVNNECIVDKGTVVICPIGIPCKSNQCNPATGKCEPKPVGDGTPCTDGNKCTLNDSCQDGECVGVAADCDDGNPCTKDTCQPGPGCLHEPKDGIKCNDGNPCTIEDHCADGKCMGEKLSCDDGNSCTDDNCYPGIGCQHAPLNAVPCDDGSKCTLFDQCLDGACIGEALDCDDGNACTTDSCDPAVGCIFDPGPGPACPVGAIEAKACVAAGEYMFRTCKEDCTWDSWTVCLQSAACPDPGGTGACGPGPKCGTHKCTDLEVWSPCKDDTYCDGGDQGFSVCPGQKGCYSKPCPQGCKFCTCSESGNWVKCSGFCLM